MGRAGVGVLCCLAAALTASVGAAYAASTPMPRSTSTPARVAVTHARPQLVSSSVSPTAYPTITFDEVPLETYVTNDYAYKGVVFTSTVQTSSDEANPTSPVLSGYPRFQGSIEGYFVNPATGEPQTVASFTLDVGYINNRDSVVVEAFDGSGNVVQSVLAEGYGINTLTLTYGGISSFSVHEVAEEPAGFAIDNLSIDPTANPMPVQSVASMGDSYTSGEGLLPGQGTNYDCGTDMSGNLYFQDTTLPFPTPFSGGRLWNSIDCDTRTLTNQQPNLLQRPPTFYENTCHRHGLAYPVQIAGMLHATQSIFVACSGATTANIGEIPTTEKAQHPHSPVNIAGGNTQVTDLVDFRRERLGGQDPSLITIGIGGNDAGFSGIAQHCIVTILPCSSDQNFVDSVLNKIHGPVYEKLETTFTALRVQFPNSTIVTFGYPSPVSGSAPGCNGAPLYQQDKEFLGGTVLTTLNQAVADAADAAGISYVDISSVTAGHEICTSEPWFRGLSFPIVASFHPTQFAHDAIARYFRDHYTDGHGDLLIHNPTFLGNPIMPAQSGVAGAIANLNGGPEVSCGTGCNEAVPCIQSCSVHIQGSGYSPQAQLEAVLHSASYDLGPVTADTEGNVDATVQIPSGVPAGQHVITLDGTAPDGTPQYGAIGLDILEPSPPVPLGPAAQSSPPAHGVLASKATSKPVRALVTLKRHKRRLTAKVVCPRAAVSACTVTLTLQRSRRIHRQTHTVTLVRRTVRVPGGQSRTVTFSNPAVLTARSQLRVSVTTETLAGRVLQLLAVPR